MGRRIEFHEKLVELLGSRYVYFQPPESLKLEYPCIVYLMSRGDTRFSDNVPYTFEVAYDVTFITKDPDSPLVKTIAMHFPKCRFDRQFTADNLNHYVYTIYY